jgi:hypothetical protein
VLHACHGEQAALLLHQRADVQLRAPLARTPHPRVGLPWARIEEQLGRTASRRLQFVFLIARTFHELPGRSQRHVDLSCFAERWT